MDASLELMWSKYRGWTKRARTIRGELDRWRLRTLVLTVIGAVLATLAAQLQLPGWFPDLNGFAQALQAQRDSRRTSGSPSRTNRGLPVRAKDRQPGTKKPGEIMQEDLNAAVMATRWQPASQGRKRPDAAPATVAQPGKPAARQGKLRRTDVRP